MNWLTNTSSCCVGVSGVCDWRVSLPLLSSPRPRSQGCLLPVTLEREPGNEVVFPFLCSPFWGVARLHARASCKRGRGFAACSRVLSRIAWLAIIWMESLLAAYAFSFPFPLEKRLILRLANIQVLSKKSDHQLVESDWGLSFNAQYKHLRFEFV